MAVSYSLSKAGLEVYTTKPVKESNSSTDTTDVQNNFTLQTGETTQIDYVGELYSDSFEQDYTDISSNASVSVPITYLNYFFKGKKVALKKSWHEHGSILKWDDMDTVIMGFITEISWNREKVDLKIAGMDKLLEKEEKFTFTKTKRSEIVKKIIEASGLRAVVEIEDLKDDVIDFSNVSISSGSSSSDLAGGQGEKIDSLVKEIVGNVTDDLEKCKLIHKWLQENVRYAYYECTRYDTPEKCLANKHALNCADTARLTCSMMKSAGLNAYVVHRTTNGGHFWTIIEIGGKKYASDQTGDGSAFNTVWARSGRTTVTDGGSYTRKNGDSPDC